MKFILCLFVLISSFANTQILKFRTINMTIASTDDVLLSKIPAPLEHNGIITFNFDEHKIVITDINMIISLDIIDAKKEVDEGGKDKFIFNCVSKKGDLVEVFLTLTTFVMFSGEQIIGYGINKIE
jgi:hypothetical protein